MKSLLAFLLLFVGCLHAESPRTRQIIDADWRFQLGDNPGAESPRYDDARWQRIGLPHSFGIPYFGAPKFYTGYGWYRKHLRMAKPGPDQRVSLEFEAAFQDAEVYVNGHAAGRHQGGYTGFTFDITSAVVPGDNLVAVRLNNLWNAQLDPRAGEHQFNGGLYRNVYLVTTSDLRVDWCGTFVTTPGLSKAGGPVHIATEVRNSSGRERAFLLRTDILDARGRRVATVTSRNSAAPNSVLTVEQTTPFIARPSLWSPAHPAMYMAVTHIISDGKEVDTYTTPFGFRWIRWTAEEGFFLNGEHYYFHGADVHQDHAGWADAVTDAGAARDVRWVKQAGMDFIRGSHYPHSPAFSDACDRQGVMLWSENSFWGTGGEKVEGTWSASAYPPNERDQKPFEESVKRSLAEMIRIHRNHPSIIAWSLTNEVFFSDADLLPKVRAFLPELVAEAHALDPTRPAGAGGVQRGDLDKLTDIAGYNGDGATLFLDPGVPNLVTEYGSLESVRPGEYTPAWGDLAGQPEFPWRSGQALWCAFDHGSIFPSLGHMGMIDYFRLPKKQWYWYRNAYRGIAPPEWARPGVPAALQLHADSMAPMHTDGTDDRQLVVSVIGADGKRVANSPPVRLEIVSGPGEFPTGRAIQFAADCDIAIRDGEAAMELRAYQSGAIRVRATSPGLRPAELVLHATSGPGGGPAFVAGVTPLVSDRPYERPSDTGVAHAAAIDISLNRPTAASSSAPGHSSRMANDGDPSTYWQPVPDGESWWQVDFEGHCALQRIDIEFREKGVHRFRIEAADDHGGWTAMVDRSSAMEPDRAWSGPLRDAANVRVLRLVFAPGGGPVRLSEVRVFGTPAQ